MELIEYGSFEDWPLPSSKHVNQSSIQWKQRLGLREEPFRLSIKNNQTIIRAIGVTGFINIDGVDIEIKPKFLATSASEKWRKILWNILLFIENSSKNIFSEASIKETSDADNFLDLLGWIFLNSMQEASTEGFPRGYIEGTGYHTEIKGNIDYSKISSILERPFVFPCKYDIYSEDINVNRLLKWAGQFLSERTKSFKLSNLILESIQHIQADGSRPPGLIEAENIILPVQFHYAEIALKIAKMLLKQESLYFKSSSMKSFGFLWNSHDVYENFLHKILMISASLFESKHHLKRHEKTSIASPHIGTSQFINQYPDYKIKKNNETIFILDAKYKKNKILKNLQHGLAGSEDVNQVIVACNMDKCLHGVLLFPSGDIHGTYHQTWEVNNEGYPKYISNIYINLEEMYLPNGHYILARKIFNELKTIRLYAESMEMEYVL